MTEAELLNLLLAKNESAFRLFVEKYQKLVYNACFYILNNYQDAEDISQEVFIEAYLSVSGFRGNSKLSTWLYRIAINKSKNLLRKNRWQMLIQKFDRFKSGEKVETFDAEDLSANEHMNVMEKTEDQKVLWKAIESLPENQRIAFTLNKYNELSYQEIAEALQTSLPAVESLIHRAKLNLQKKLNKYFSEK